MPEDRTEGGADDRDLVILIHGIRTRADWYVRVCDELAAAGFLVERTNYGRFNLVKFLLPVPFFKAWAAADIEQDIRAAMARHKVDRVSIIAHSFGTFIVAWILKNKFDINFRRIIFCGSVVKFRFPFQQYTSRFEGVIVNEVGTRDIWPILAESATWGYGSTGAFGFNRPGVFDRYHRGLSHSAFLNAKFCRKWWIPALKGEDPKSNDEPERPPLWLRILSVIHAKYIVVALLALWAAFAWCRAPEREVAIPARDVYFAGDLIGRLVREAEEPCARWCPEFLQCQRCMKTTARDGAAEKLVLCRTAGVRFTYRDPATALESLQAKGIACLDVTGAADRKLEVRLKKTFVGEATANNGQKYWLCGCDDEGRKRLLEIVNK